MFPRLLQSWKTNMVSRFDSMEATINLLSAWMMSGMNIHDLHIYDMQKAMCSGRVCSIQESDPWLQDIILVWWISLILYHNLYIDQTGYLQHDETETDDSWWIWWMWPWTPCKTLLRLIILKEWLNISPRVTEIPRWLHVTLNVDTRSRILVRWISWSILLSCLA